MKSEDKQAAIQKAAFLGFPYVSLNSVKKPKLILHPTHGILIAENETSRIIGISEPSEWLTTSNEWRSVSKHAIHYVCVSNEERVRFLNEQRKRYWLEAIEKKKTICVSDLAPFLCDYVYHARATDLHLLPQKHAYHLTYRVDGLRQALMSIPLTLGERLIRHWQWEADLDHTQHQPQDGTIKLLSKNHSFQLRIHVCHTHLGASIAIRLPRRNHQHSISQLNMPKQQESALLKQLAQPQGLLLVTGPTGSGKTHTLYCCLQELQSQGRHVITMEDPVEHQLPGVTQIPIKKDSSLSYQAAMRHALRQDPDVIFIGEIRDHETAAMCLQAAQTGHLVLASCHTNHSLATCDRLLELGLSLKQVAHCHTSIIAQRLVRCFCNMCLNKNDHCLYCENGYRGRQALFECITLTPALTEAIEKKEHAQINDITKKQNIMWLHEHAKACINTGITSFTECQRVLGALLNDQWKTNHV